MMHSAMPRSWHLMTADDVRLKIYCLVNVGLLIQLKEHCCGCCTKDRIPYMAIAHCQTLFAYYAVCACSLKN